MSIEEVTKNIYSGIYTYYQDTRMPNAPAPHKLAEKVASEIVSKLIQSGWRTPSEVQEIVKKAREAVMDKLKEAYPAITTWPIWQALKEGRELE